jgi:hypothetical protein
MHGTWELQLGNSRVEFGFDPNPNLQPMVFWANLHPTRDLTHIKTHGAKPWVASREMVGGRKRGS